MIEFLFKFWSCPSDSCSPLLSVIISAFYKNNHYFINLVANENIDQDLTQDRPHRTSLNMSSQPDSIWAVQWFLTSWTSTSAMSIACHHLCFLKSMSRGTALKTHESQDIPYLLLPVISWAISPSMMEIKLVQHVVLFANHCCLFFITLSPRCLTCDHVIISFGIFSGIKVSMTSVFSFLPF